MSEEQLEIINEKGEVVGLAPRSAVHRDPSLLHRVVHILVFDRAGRMLLQKRAPCKDVAPGKWDTSVGGHVEAGEGLFTAAGREMKEELGIAASEIEYLYSYTHTNHWESELVTTYRCVYSGVDIRFHKGEIDEVRYWSRREIEEAMGKGILSDNFEHEFGMYLSHLAARSDV